jgi:uroporphyrin-III C-methyltransferase/precorrin-2 dehydrogenase/sirohydrochlorin ferrochelatase
MNNLCPIFMKLEFQPVLVVGGGKVAEQKIRTLLDAGANVTVIAPEVSETIEQLSKANRIYLVLREYADYDVDGFAIVIAATGDPKVQRRIYEQARARLIPVNVADVPELCTFYFGSTFQSGDLKIAVSTNGKSPTLGKIIRDKIKDEFSRGYPEIIRRVGELRLEVRNVFTDFRSRKKFLEEVIRVEMEQSGLTSETDSGTFERQRGKNGKVFLVGAGPGDPELITVKGVKILRCADVVLYDALVSKRILDEIPEPVEKVLVGKRAGEHNFDQVEINKLLICKAREGKLVVRLKCGDPFVFGRGGEEMEALRMAGVDFEIVPGITAGVGVPSSIGIPLTYRGESSSVVFVTGHEVEDKKDGRVDWGNLSHADTVVIYMGIRNLDSIVNKLHAYGVPLSKPTAVIFNGTMPNQQVVVGTLEDIAKKVKDFHEEPPGLVVIGEVVRFFDRRIAKLSGIDVGCREVSCRGNFLTKNSV